MTNAKVQLICMPYQNITLSSLSIVLLSTLLKSQGIDAIESYLHFKFAEIIGEQTYSAISLKGMKESLTGELLFAEDYRGRIEDPCIQQRLDALFGKRADRATMLALYKEYCLSRIAEVGPDLVGFSTSCSQLFPSIWLARHIKRQWPHIKIVFGGSSCSSPMGDRIQQFYPHVDYVVSGYGEKPLLDLASGNISAANGLIVNEARVHLDDLPIPDYGPFLAEARQASDKANQFMLAFESSRGCWWGQKNHCTFCGLNQIEMAFNAKSASRVIREIRTLWDMYQINLFATDTILSRAHLKEVLPVLSAYDSKPLIFYEVKGNMTREEVSLLKAANILWIQPGIESLSSTLLRRMKKGITSIQNIALLKWCREQQISVSWNMLCGIPGETAQDYEEQISLSARIPHLQPPQGVSPIRLDRYSPYFEAYADYGWTQIEPLAEYRHLHPQMDQEALHDVAYHFEGVGGALFLHQYLDRLQRAVADWKTRYASGEGLFWDRQKRLIRVQDGETDIFECDPMFVTVIENTHEIIGIEKLLALAGCAPGLLQEWVDQGILHREDNKIVNLAVEVPI